MSRVAEALRSRNVRAFLRAIRLGEGTSDAMGYRRLFGDGEFESFDDHPRIRTYEQYDGQFIKNGRIDYTTAAGAFQIVETTWEEARAALGLTDFSPVSQDLAAVWLIDRRRALDDVLAGRIERAIDKCKMEWASLPGSTYGQRTESMARVLEAYQVAGGTFLPTPPLDAHWSAIKGEELPQYVATMLLDAALDHDIRPAVRMMQRAVGTKDDGIIGPKTIEAATLMERPRFAARFAAEQMLFLMSLTTWEARSREWAARIAAQLRLV